jgi:hypothetical protein
LQEIQSALRVHKNWAGVPLSRRPNEYEYRHAAERELG